LPICFAVWVWGLVVAARTPLQPAHSSVSHTGGAAG
jgi:hypothetical protein